MRAPSADHFPAYPVSWYLFGPAHALGKAPISRMIFGRRLVAFRTASGRVAVLDARCSHFGADLGNGCVSGETLRCSFHQWEYATDGRCVHIPRVARIPDTAGQEAYPVVERHGFLFVFNGREPRFALPFFPGLQPEKMVPARSFRFVLACPWYMLGANFFDLQHFRGTHDREVIGEPRVDCPDPFARRANARFRITGHTLQDVITRRFAGDEVEMTILDWCGNLMFTTARFSRTRSYGMAVTEPLAEGGVVLTLIVFVPRSHGLLGRRLVDPLNAYIRRLFIRRFLSADAARLNGMSYYPCGLIDEDRHLAEYLHWLAEAAQGTSPREANASTGVTSGLAEDSQAVPSGESP